MCRWLSILDDAFQNLSKACSKLFKAFLLFVWCYLVLSPCFCFAFNAVECFPMVFTVFQCSIIVQNLFDDFRCYPFFSVLLYSMLVDFIRLYLIIWVSVLHSFIRSYSISFYSIMFYPDVFDSMLIFVIRFYSLSFHSITWYSCCVIRFCHVIFQSWPVQSVRFWPRLSSSYVSLCTSSWF